jgi:Spy/CpxP family protein refolding chaperone
MTPEERSAAWERRRKEMEDRHWGETAKSLNLNETQTAAMRSASDALRSAARDMAAKLQEAGKLDMDNMRQQGQLLRQQYEAQLSQILSAEQLENYRNQPRSMLRMMDFMLGREARRLERGGDGSPEP